MKWVDGVLYCNDGDWVENCTALAEDDKGRLSLLRWGGAEAAHAAERPREAVPAAA